jgi:hypothetical protein
MKIYEFDSLQNTTGKSIHHAVSGSTKLAAGTRTNGTRNISQYLTLNRVGENRIFQEEKCEYDFLNSYEYVQLNCANNYTYNHYYQHFDLCIKPTNY